MKITKSKLKQMILEELEDIRLEQTKLGPGGQPLRRSGGGGDLPPGHGRQPKKRPGKDFMDDLIRMLNAAKALSAAMDAVKKKMPWNKETQKLAGDVYAAERALEDYLS